MRISHTSEYQKLIRIAEKHNCTDLSFQYHTFCSFNTLQDATNFDEEVKHQGFKTWGINTERPHVPFEVMIERWK